MFDLAGGCCPLSSASCGVYRLAMMEEPRDPPPEEEGSELHEEGPQQAQVDDCAMVWGGRAPSEEERLSLMQEMVAGRMRLDRLLSNLPADPSASPDRAALVASRKAQSRRYTDASVFFEAVDVLREDGGAATDAFYELLSKSFGQPPASPSGGSSKWSREVKVPLTVAVPPEQLGQLERELPGLNSVPESEVSDVHLHLEDVAGQADEREVAWAGGTEEVLQQVRRAVQRLDRILPCREAEERAATALRAVLLCLSQDQAWVTQGLAHLFRGAVRLDVIKTARRHLRLRFGVRHWRPQSFGLGVFIESYFRVRLLPEKQQGEEEGALATVLCGCSHAFSLGQEEEVYADAVSEGEEGAAAARMACDLRVSQLSLRLRMREADGGAGGDAESIDSAEGMEVMSSDGSLVMDDGPNNFNPLLPLRAGGRAGDTSPSGGGGTKRPRPVLGSMYTRPLVAQVYGWGENQCGCLGFSGEGVRAEPHLLPAISSLPVMERVIKVALSSRHALLVTSLGSVYSSGDGTDGALGHGDLLSVHRFRIIDFFARQKPPPLITAVSAAADLLGSHSAAVDSDGRLYTWGFGQATGHSVSKPVQEPKDVTELLGDGEEEEKRVLAVACGGGYCLALVQGGQVYSWGLWAHGRLGLGPPAVHTDNFNRRRMHKYKLKPGLVQGRLERERVVRIAAGTGHSLAVTDTGLLYSWGRDDFGQLGLDARTSNGFVSVFEPELVSAFSSGRAGQRAVDVACGAFHSLALDDRGQVWSWGAAGGACLGHGDAVSVEGRPADLPTLLRRQQATDKRLPVLAAKPVWAMPRRVEALANIPVRRLAGGSHHSAAVTEDGSLFLWGESLSTLQPVAEDEEEDQGEEEAEEAGEEDGPAEERQGDGEARKKKGEEEGQEVDEEEEEEGKGQVDLEGVHVPCQPTSNWLPQLAGKWVEVVACGGHSTVVVACGDRVGMVLGRKLLQGVTRASSSDSGDDEASVSSVRSFLGTEGTERDGAPPPDVLLLVSGRVLPAHKLILARRSPTFRDLIAAEERPGDASPLQLVLPDLRVDVCRALLQFLYTDNLFGALDFRSSLPVELLAAAHAYQLPRLAAMCTSFLGQPPAATTPGGRPSRPPRLPPCMMPADVGGGLGDTAWADVRFIASGRALLAHRFILAAQSEYFCAMFRSGMREGAIRAHAPVEIAVPDSYGCMARLLLFLYSGTLAAASNDDVVEDLMAADRYRLLELKRLCESMVRITPGNCLDVFRVADLYSAPRLRHSALSFAVRHLGRVAAQPNYLPFAEAHPDLMRVIFDKIKATSPHTYSTVEEAEPEPPLSEEEAKKKKEQEEQAFDPGPFPWLPLGMLVVLALVYREASRTIALGPLIPALNIGLTLALVVYGITVLRAK